MERKTSRFSWILKQNSISLIWSSCLRLSDRPRCWLSGRMISEKRGTFIVTLHRTAPNHSPMLWLNRETSPTWFAITDIPALSHRRMEKSFSEFCRQTWTSKTPTPIMFKTCLKWPTWESTSHDCTRLATLYWTIALKSRRNITTPSPTWLFGAHARAMAMLPAAFHWKDLTPRTTWCMEDASVHTTPRVWIASTVKISIMICRGNLLWENKRTLAKVS